MDPGNDQMFGLSGNEGGRAKRVYEFRFTVKREKRKTNLSEKEAL
jgi:hypothetical protein